MQINKVYFSHKPSSHNNQRILYPIAFVMKLLGSKIVLGCSKEEFYFVGLNQILIEEGKLLLAFLTAHSDDLGVHVLKICRRDGTL